MLKIEKVSGLCWEGRIGAKLVCEFRYFKDSNSKVWVNTITTFGDYQGKGYGTQMIIRALEEYKEIYVSTAEKIEIKEKRLPDDYRYHNEFSFKESNIGRFTKRLVEKGILHENWIMHPFKAR